MIEGSANSVIVMEMVLTASFAIVVEQVFERPQSKAAKEKIYSTEFGFPPCLRT